MKTARARNVRQKNDTCRHELPKRALQARNAPNAFIQKHHAGVKDRRAKPQSDAQAIRMQIAEARNEQDTHGRHDKANNLRFRHFFAEQERRDDRHENGRNIITKRRR